MAYTNILIITLLNVITGIFARPQNENEGFYCASPPCYTVEDQVELEPYVTYEFYVTGQFWIVLGIFGAITAAVGIYYWKKKQSSIAFQHGRAHRTDCN